MSQANLDAKNQEKINQLLFSLPQAVVEVIHHYTKEDLKRYDKVIHLKSSYANSVYRQIVYLKGSLSTVLS